MIKMCAPNDTIIFVCLVLTALAGMFMGFIFISWFLEDVAPIEPFLVKKQLGLFDIDLKGYDFGGMTRLAVRDGKIIYI